MTLVSFSVPSSPVQPQTMVPAGFEALADAMASRDGLTHLHAERVQHYARVLARQARIEDAAVLHALETAALLHDVGKLGIPDRLLHKPGPLTRDEYEQVKRHAILGSNMLAALPAS